jgi:uncharacterized protein YbaR (Trm112 family)
MEKKLLEILVCPVCKGELTLEITAEKDDEIESGSLYCARCEETYPIVDSIPHLLPPVKSE